MGQPGVGWTELLFGVLWILLHQATGKAALGMKLPALVFSSAAEWFAVKGFCRLKVQLGYSSHPKSESLAVLDSFCLVTYSPWGDTGVLLFAVEGIKIAVPCAGGSCDIALVSYSSKKIRFGGNLLFQGALDADNRVSASWNNSVMCIISLIPWICLLLSPAARAGLRLLI